MRGIKMEKMRMNGHHDSFSSDDELPIKYCSNASDPKNSYKALCRRKKMECEFCDQTFMNRYQGLIHNATHIVIPLLNQIVLECEHCHFCFTSPTDLERHISKVHSPVTLEKSQKKRVKMRNRIQFEEDDLTILPDLLTDLTNNVSVTLNRSLSKEIMDTLEERFKKEFNLSLGERMKSAQWEKHIRRNSVDLDWIDSHEGFKNGLCKDVSDGSSVHYEELKKPVPVRCKYCKNEKMFKDRYDLVVHQISHVRINHRRVYTNTPPKKRPETKLSNYSSPLPTNMDRLLKVCDLCYAFLKPKTRVQYVRKGNINQPGKRSRCNMCSRKFFELNLVVRTKLMYKKREKIHRKRLTNDQRLKNIRHRFKAANKVLKRSWCFICSVHYDEIG